MSYDFTRRLKALLPRGPAWTQNKDSTLHKLMSGLAVEFGRLQGRGTDLLAEMYPPTSTELLPDWERVAGLPDDCNLNPPTDLQGRRDAVTAVLKSRGGWSGGPSVPFLSQVAADLGFDDFFIRRFHHQPFTCESACDEHLNSDNVGWIYVWEFVAISQGSQLDQQLECLMERYTLAHLQSATEGLAMAFPLLNWTDGTVTRAAAATFTNPVTGAQAALATNELGTVYLWDI